MSAPPSPGSKPSPPAAEKAPRREAMLLLAGSYLLGLAHMAVLPPFEGFDETAHYAYLQQLALTGTWPRHGDPMGADIDNYLAVAPAATEMRARWSYRRFFDAGPEAEAAGRAAVHDPGTTAASWRPGTIRNWEAQHPPLYYALLSPAYRLAAQWSLGARLLLLRIVSYSLAWLGLALCVGLAMRDARPSPVPRTVLVLAPALWPLLLPMWFPEMARLGNDSLVTLLAGFAVLFARRVFGGRASRGDHLALGLCLGLGLLTKATFLPLAAATLGFSAALALKGRRGAAWGFVIAVATVLVVAGWWYVGQALRTGALIGSNDAIEAAQSGGVLEGLRRSASFSVLAHMVGTFAFTFVGWVGTWSFAGPPLVTMVPLLAGALVLAVAGAQLMASARLAMTDVFPLVVLALFVGGLAFQSLFLVVETGSAAPAWYLHAMAPVLSPLLAWGLTGALRQSALRLALRAEILYGPLFLLVAVSAEVLFNTGCAARRDGHALIDLGSVAACLSHPGIIAERLATLGYPALAVPLFVAGFGLLVCGALAVQRALSRQPPPVLPLTPGGAGSSGLVRSKTGADPLSTILIVSSAPGADRD